MVPAQGWWGSLGPSGQGSAVGGPRQEPRTGSGRASPPESKASSHLSGLPTFSTLQTILPSSLSKMGHLASCPLTQKIFRNALLTSPVWRAPPGIASQFPPSTCLQTSGDPADIWRCQQDCDPALRLGEHSLQWAGCDAAG